MFPAVGVDGWITDPSRRDTDGDTWWDGSTMTVGGTTYVGEATKGTSPLSVDTDQDGAWDHVDVDPKRNLLVAVKVRQLHHGDAWWNPELVGVVRVNEGNEWVHTWVTAHRLGTDDGSDDHTATFDMTYYSDVPDGVSGVSIRSRPAPPLNSTRKLGRLFIEVPGWHAVSSQRGN